MKLTRRAAIVGAVPLLAGCSTYNQYAEWERQKVEEVRSAGSEAVDRDAPSLDEITDSMREMFERDDRLYRAIQTSTTVSGITINYLDGEPHLAVVPHPHPEIRSRHCSFNAATNTTQCDSRSSPVTVDDVFIYEEENPGNALPTERSGTTWQAPIHLFPGTYDLVAGVSCEEVNERAYVGFTLTVADDADAELHPDEGWHSNA